jgi:hypothetical protein
MMMDGMVGGWMDEDRNGNELILFCLLLINKISFNDVC